MKTRVALASLMFVTFLPSQAFSAISLSWADDSDISATQKGTIGQMLASETEAPPLALSPDEVTLSEKGDGPLEIQILRMDHDAWTPVSGLELKSPTFENLSFRTDADGKTSLPGCLNSGGDVNWTAELSNEKFKIARSSHENYSIHFGTPCHGTAEIRFKSETNAGQVLGIWQVAQHAHDKLKEAVRMDFWKARLNFIWPAQADYYMFGEVHLTRGDHWDVIGHEMGHGIYDMAKIGAFGGGQHKIDECYSPELALSEGWASFFSAWVTLDLADADAHFEFMVPRRAPIRIENVPLDVCRGERNEWRVSSFFWDLVDLHADGETSTESFARIWNTLLNKNVSKTSAARVQLEKAGFDAALMATVWDLNF